MQTSTAPDSCLLRQVYRVRFAPLREKQRRCVLHTGNASETRPSSRDDGVVDNGGGAGGSAGLTLEFNLAAINRRPDRQTRLVAATLNLWKRLTRADNGRTLCMFNFYRMTSTKRLDVIAI